jgi:hypothetical protein
MVVTGHYSHSCVDWQLGNDRGTGVKSPDLSCPHKDAYKVANHLFFSEIIVMTKSMATMTKKHQTT